MFAEYAACGLLIGWFGLTLARYAKPAWAPRMLTAGGLKLVPRWWLFGNPVVANGHVLYRAVTRDGHAFPWQQLRFAPSRTLVQTVWSPQRRSAVMFVRSQRALWRLCAHGTDRDSVEISTAFLCLLGAVIRAVKAGAHADAEFCQFLLTYEPPEGSAGLVFRSGLHRVEPA